MTPNPDPHTVGGDGEEVSCDQCGNTAFIDARRMEAFREARMVSWSRSVWVCTSCNAHLDLQKWISPSAD